MTVRKMLLAAISAGFTLQIGSEGEVDYDGNNIVDAMDAVEALEEVDVYVEDAGEIVGWACIIPDLDSDEQIANCSGWVDQWVEQNR
jgi:hypothetical protein